MQMPDIPPDNHGIVEWSWFIEDNHVQSPGWYRIVIECGPVLLTEIEFAVFQAR